MQLAYVYDREKDVECLLTKGKSSNNSSKATKVYEQLVAAKGDNPAADATNDFINEYLTTNNISVDEWTKKYQEGWSVISDEYQKRAEAIFGTALPHDITGLLTVNNRCPYNISENYFYISFPHKPSNSIAIHELWHFYTWYGIGADEEARLGKEKYNEIKEALTVLLNFECPDLLGEGVTDEGYPQHQELRSQMTAFWSETRDIKALWSHFAGKEA